MTDWDAIAAEVGLPPDWREAGWDTPETMQEMYPDDEGGAMVCPWPHCNFRRRTDVEAMFRHAHGAHRRTGGAR